MITQDLQNRHLALFYGSRVRPHSCWNVRRNDVFVMFSNIQVYISSLNNVAYFLTKHVYFMWRMHKKKVRILKRMKTILSKHQTPYFYFSTIERSKHQRWSLLKRTMRKVRLNRRADNNRRTKPILNFYLSLSNTAPRCPC